MMVCPHGLMPYEFLERAEEFYQAYRDLPARSPPSWPRYFMLCHSIELALKAYEAKSAAGIRAGNCRGRNR
jgi:hypothetical protein